MYALYIKINKEEVNIPDGYFSGLIPKEGEFFPLNISVLSDAIKTYPDKKKAEIAANALQEKFSFISSYEIKEIEYICNDFNCAFINTAFCPDTEGCEGCQLYHHCMFCANQIGIYKGHKYVCETYKEAI